MTKKNAEHLGKLYDKKGNLMWKVNTPQLFKEILSNKETGILRAPLQITANLLVQVGERCAELNDPVLNALMCRLSIYSVSDPYNKEFDTKITEETILKGTLY